MLYTLSKLGCLALYGLALSALLLGWPGGSLATVLQGMGLVMLALHVLEALLVRKQLAQFPGSLAGNVGLTLLFGLLHWKPLLAAQAKAGTQPPTHTAP